MSLYIERRMRDDQSAYNRPEQNKSAPSQSVMAAPQSNGMYTPAGPKAFAICIHNK